MCMWTRGRGARFALGAAAAMAFIQCSSGGFTGDGFGPGPSPHDLGTSTDQHGGGDLRRTLSDKVAFGTARGYPIVRQPFYLLVYDINTDGKLDILSSGQGIGVLLGKGDGTFGDVINASTVSGSGLAAGDLNGDGKPDVVFASGVNAQVMLGRGDGTFDPPRSVPVGNNGISVALGDVNRDGKLDLAVADYGVMAMHYVYVLPGKGDGSFGTAVKVQVGSNPYTVRLADFNRDERLDFAVCNYGGMDVSMALGKGDGTFLPSSLLPSEPSPIVLETVDMNGDSLVDMVVGSENRASISVHFGKGDGTFQPALAAPVSGDRNTYDLAAGDVNGDGVGDVVTASANNGTKITVQLGRGDGTFVQKGPFPAGKDLFAVKLGDFNNDGFLDIAAADASSPGQIFVLLNTTSTSP